MNFSLVSQSEVYLVGEINIRMEQCGNEMKMLVVEEDADLLYKEYKGTVILLYFHIGGA